MFFRPRLCACMAALTEPNTLPPKKDQGLVMQIGTTLDGKSPGRVGRDTFIVGGVALQMITRNGWRCRCRSVVQHDEEPKKVFN